MEFRTTYLARQLYRLLLYLYPPTFRREFGGEMDDVFAQRSSEARQRGWTCLVSALWSEMADLPASRCASTGSC